MPNTPALVGMGVTGVCYEAERFSAEERDTIRQFFESFGSMELVEERLMNAVVCVSGSSPAYVYMFIEALQTALSSTDFPGILRTAWPPARLWEAQKWFSRQVNIQEN